MLASMSKMFIKQEQLVRLGQNVWNNHSLRGGQHQHFDATIQNVTDNSFTDPATLKSQVQLRKHLHSQDRRRLKTQHRRLPQLNQLIQQDIIDWAQGLSHPIQIQGCQPQQRQLPDLPHPQVNQFQGRLHQQKLAKMEHKHFPYVVGSDGDCWQVADSYGTEFLSDMSTYNTPGDGVHQTTGGYHVSGRELGTSHLQSNNQQHLDNNIMASSTSHHMAWPTFQTTYNDKYSPPPFASIDSDCPRQQAMPAIFGDPSSTNYLGMHHGLPSNDWAIDPNMPILEESMLCNGQVSPPDTAYSSFSSTSASEAMASMSLDTPIGTSSISSSDMIMACPSTISPKVLRINPSPAPTCSSDSTHTTFLPGGDGNISSASSFEQQYIPPVTSKRLNAKGRKVLPDRPRTPLLLSFQTEASSSRRSWDKHAASHRSKHLADLRPKPRISLPESPTTKDPETMERNKQNEFLIQSKQAGMTYRDIKREGGFKEAESTLRGRYRTLTKPKLARVRKPEWSDRDIDLLRKAVHKLTKGGDPTSTKIPWKQVSAYIAKNGGSYNFGYATCAKRWDEMLAHEKYC